MERANATALIRDNMWMDADCGRFPQLPQNDRYRDAPKISQLAGNSIAVFLAGPRPPRSIASPDTPRPRISRRRGLLRRRDEQRGRPVEDGQFRLVPPMSYWAIRFPAAKRLHTVEASGDAARRSLIKCETKIPHLAQWTCGFWHMASIPPRLPRRLRREARVTPSPRRPRISHLRGLDTAGPASDESTRRIIETTCGARLCNCGGVVHSTDSRESRADSERSGGLKRA